MARIVPTGIIVSIAASFPPTELIASPISGGKEAFGNNNNGLIKALKAKYKIVSIAVIIIRENQTFLSGVISKRQTEPKG